jgi:hypothetical protein
MAIAFSCVCGAAFDVPDDLAGLHAPCPNCHLPLVVPVAADDDVVEDVEVEDGPGPYRFADGAAIPLVDDAPPLRLAHAAVPEADDEPEVVGDAEPAEMVEDADPDDDATPEYFVAAYPPGGTLRHPKTFRLYPYGSELLVLHAGPFCWGLVGTLIDRPGVRETVRRDDLGSGAGPLGADTDVIVRKQLAQRAAVLDRMTLAELRAEAGTDRFSFRVTADNTPKARIEPPPRDDYAETRTAHLVTGRVKFTHAMAGKWELLLLSPAEARMAMRAFRRVLGDENVEVTLRLKDGRE